ncbi:hypothetical protein BDV06DRAFT_229112 [Aspergillus oleicola]
MAQPKRIILRSRLAEFDARNMYEAVYAYLENIGRPAEELNEGRHYIHVEPDNSHIDPQRDHKIHIIIDFEKDKHSGPLGPDFPHELYRVRRVDGKMELTRFPDDPYYQNFISKIRRFSDDFYPWGISKQDIRIENGTSNLRPVEA